MPSPLSSRALKLTAMLAAVCALSLASARHTHAAAADVSDAELTKKECGACHFPYARDWLPGYSWKQILEHLDDHFGENATLKDDVRKRIENYMIGDRDTEIPTRVTKADWWVAAHGGPSIYSYALKQGFSVSQCEKCHR